MTEKEPKIIFTNKRTGKKCIITERDPKRGIRVKYYHNNRRYWIAVGNFDKWFSA